jgi:hypothetical protein
MGANWYATLAQGRGALNVTEDDRRDDDAMKQALLFASSRFEDETDRVFAPVIKTRFFNSLGYHIDDLKSVLGVDEPLLESSEVTINVNNTGGGTVLVDGTDYRDYPQDRTPLIGLRRLLNQSWSLSSSSDWIEDISVTGIWGYRTNYPTEAWQLAADHVLDASGITANVTSVTVASVTGDDDRGLSPQFSVGNLIRMGTEFCYVTDVNDIAKTLTLLRHVNGSSPASHAINTAIDVWVPEETVTAAVARWAAYLYQRRGAFEVVTFAGQTVIKFPSDIPEDIESVIEIFRDKSWRSVEVG